MMMKTCNGKVVEPVIRPATQANRFYTGDAKELSEEVDSFLAQHRGETVYNNVAALIVPHAGYYYSGNVAATAYMSMPKDKPYKRIFLLGPSHHEWLDGASVNAEADYYATPLGHVKVDHETALRLTDSDSVFSYQPKAHDREHCLEVQLPFLQRRFGENVMPSIVPIIISTNDYQKLKRIANVLKPYFTEENLFVISSDFSHYPSYEDACEVDAKTGKAIETGNVEQFIAVLEENSRSGKRNLATSACGELAIATLLLMMDRTYEVKHLLYQNSGDVDNQEHNRVVGYHAFAILRGASQEFVLSDEEKKILKEIAFTSIKDSLAGKPVAQPILNSQYPVLNSKCGAFVSLHKQGRLRGCIGHFGEDVPLHEIVAEMARAAAFEDPRFMPVTKDELEDIDIEISVLSHCAQDKAGIGWDGWRDAELYVYEAIVF